MAYHVRVILSRSRENLVVEGQWGHQENHEFFSVELQRGMTAAESVEYHFLEKEMVPSWTWSSSADGKSLNCEFVFEPNLKAIKNSGAEKFDL